MLYIVVHVIALISFILITMHWNKFLGFEIKNDIILILVGIIFLVFGAWVFIYDVFTIPKMFGIN